MNWTNDPLFLPQAIGEAWGSLGDAAKRVADELAKTRELREANERLAHRLAARDRWRFDWLSRSTEEIRRIQKDDQKDWEEEQTGEMR